MRLATILALSGVLPLKAADQIISISNPWARPTIAASTTSAGYVTIRNSGAKADRLLAAKTEFAQSVEIHTHIMDGDIARMRRVEAVDVPAGQTVAFNPGGLHLMVLGLKQPLKEGESLPLTLVFETAGEIKVTAAVRKSAPAAPAAAGGHHH